MRDSSPSERESPESPEPQGADRLYRHLVESLTEYAMFTVSPEGAVMTWNAGAQRTFGHTGDAIIGKSVALLFTPEDIASGQPAREFSKAIEEGRVDRDCWHLRGDGTRFWATNTVQPLRSETGTLTGFSKVVRDSTERYLATAALRASEERLRLLIESVTDYAIFAVSADGTITLWNSGAENLFGYDEAAILGAPLSSIYTRADIENGVPELELRQASEQGSANADRWYVRKNGTRFFATGKLTRLAPDSTGTARGFVKIAHDITERKHQEELMRHEAFHDNLTGLPNRTLFFEHLDKVLAHAKRFKERHFAVLFMDLDDFKSVNDRYGHALADLLLIEVARRLEAIVRPEDVIGRLGGDEFTMLLADVDEVGQAIEVAERVRDTLAEPFLFDDNAYVLRATIGIAIGSAAYDRAEHVLRDADIAMYEAKARGRDCYVTFDQSMRARGAARRVLKTELRRALKDREFELRYQPIVALSSSRVVGFEALVRWNHPDRGTLAPADFLPAAEESGLLVGIDRWVLDTACRQLGEWQSKFGDSSLTMAVNHSAQDLGGVDVLAGVVDAVQRHSLVPNSLMLELAEDVLMEPSESVVKLLGEIRKTGIQLCIDDFGTGYFQLSNLRRFGATTLKIDRSFVRGMAHHPDSAEIVRTVISLAHNLRLKVVGLGVESTEVAQALRKLDCDYAQGYFFSGPLDARAAGAIIGPR